VSLFIFIFNHLESFSPSIFLFLHFALTSASEPQHLIISASQHPRYHSLHSFAFKNQMIKTFDISMKMIVFVRIVTSHRPR
jgi:hypothetical protein